VEGQEVWTVAVLKAELVVEALENVPAAHAVHTRSAAPAAAAE
jgi:hypothetical protein